MEPVRSKAMNVSTYNLDEIFPEFYRKASGRRSHRKKFLKMSTQKFKRKLSAILSADVEGYSRLMGEDEVNTIRTLTVYKEAMADLIERHQGRVLDAPGDNLLAEFGSVVDAVLCAVEIQSDLDKRNEEMPEESKMVFRIGVNHGDVVEEKNRIYGDGVNIAARLESIC